jgi:hypothetical protein
MEHGYAELEEWPISWMCPTPENINVTLCSTGTETDTDTVN